MFTREPTETDERAVSEVLAFILVFTIVIGSVTIVSVFGMQSLTSYQEGEQLRNAERAMDALSDNFNDVVRYDGITTRSGELNLRDGSITTNHEGTELSITIDGGSDHTITTGGLVYEAGSGTDTIAYEGGGIFRGDHTGNVALERPMIRCTEDTAVISLLVIEQEPRTFQSSEISQISISETDSIRRTYTNPGDVTITVDDSDYKMGWERTLEQGEWDWNEDDSEATCTPDRVTIHIVTAELDY
ncbi:DUF7289 family protein [Natronosalvus vescus]|uniref:DUF7289 family protein n=1 Tax=Natronosalvus vescus TaxID=2953881 RepID=UPI0020904282|nr:hypothetical protein [Natronosalvus vescus]